jgi:hypothetical protein
MISLNSSSLGIPPKKFTPNFKPNWRVPNKSLEGLVFLGEFNYVALALNNSTF